MRVNNIIHTDDYEFPVLLENTRYGTIILAWGWQTESKTTLKGICLHSRDNKEDIGQQKYWANEAFTLFKGEITLEQ